MTQRYKLVVVLGTAMVLAFGFAMANFADAQGGRPFRPNMYNRFGPPTRTVQPGPAAQPLRVVPDPAIQRFAIEPVDVRTGEMVRVMVDTPLRLGYDVLGTVPSGDDAYRVIRVNGPWVGIAVEQDGRIVRGWVNHRAVEAIH